MLAKTLLKFWFGFETGYWKQAGPWAETGFCLYFMLKPRSCLYARPRPVRLVVFPQALDGRRQWGGPPGQHRHQVEAQAAVSSLPSSLTVSSRGIRTAADKSCFPE